MRDKDTNEPIIIESDIDPIEDKAYFEDLLPPAEIETPVQESEVPQVIRTRNHERSERRGIKEKISRAVRVSKVVLATAGVLLIANEVREFGFDFEAKENAEITVGAAKNDIRTNVLVNLAEVTSEFPLSVETSLDRPGPFNCDVKINRTKSGEQLRTVTNSGIIFERLETVKNEDGTYEVEVSGDMQIMPSFVDWTDTPILFDRELATFDACFNMDEPNQAMHIAVVTAQQAGQLASACAIGSNEGELAVEAGIKQDLRMHGVIEVDTPDENIDINFTNLDEQQDAIYGNAVREFDDKVGAVLEKYLDNDQHEAKTNFDEIRDCSEHTYEFHPQG